MPEVWATAAALVGTAVSVAGTVYSATSTGGAAPAAPKFKPIDLKKVENLATRTDTQGYALSDLKYQQRLPALVAGRDTMNQDIFSNIGGGVSPIVSSTLKDTGFGDVNLGSNAFEQSRNLGRPVTALQDRNRNYFTDFIQRNPERVFGLTGQDVAHIAIANTGGQNNWNQGLFGSRLNMYNSQVQQSAQNTQALFSGLAGALNIGTSLYNNWNSPNSLQPGYYGYNYTQPTSYGFAAPGQGGR